MDPDVGPATASPESGDGAPNRRRVALAVAAVTAIAALALVVSLGAAAVHRQVFPDPETSLPLTVEVHRDLTAIFVEELGEQPAAVEVRFAADRCRRLLGWPFASSDDSTLWLEATWPSDQDPAELDAAISAGRAYLLERDGAAEGIRTTADGTTYFASADTAGLNTGDYEASGGGSADGAYVRTISTGCVDPDSTDVSRWEAQLGSSGD